MSASDHCGDERQPESGLKRHNAARSPPRIVDRGSSARQILEWFARALDIPSPGLRRASRGGLDVPMLDPTQYGALRLYLSRKMLTSLGARANAAQGLRNVQRDRSDRAEGDRALADAGRRRQAIRIPDQRSEDMRRPSVSSEHGPLQGTTPPGPFVRGSAVDDTTDRLIAEFSGRWSGGVVSALVRLAARDLAGTRAGPWGELLERSARQRLLDVSGTATGRIPTTSSQHLDGC